MNKNKTNGRFMVNVVAKTNGQEIQLTEFNFRFYTREEWAQTSLPDPSYKWHYDKKIVTYNGEEIPYEYYRTYIIKREKQPDIITTAKRLAVAEGVKKRIELYKTRLGKFIVAKISWQYEDSYERAKIFETIEEIIPFLGYTDIAKEIYEQAHIEYAEVIE